MDRFNSRTIDGYAFRRAVVLSRRRNSTATFGVVRGRTVIVRVPRDFRFGKGSRFFRAFGDPVAFED